MLDVSALRVDAISLQRSWFALWKRLNANFDDDNMALGQRVIHVEFVLSMVPTTIWRAIHMHLRFSFSNLFVDDRA